MIYFDPVLELARNVVNFNFIPSLHTKRHQEDGNKVNYKYVIRSLRKIQALISDATIRCEWVFIKTDDISKLNYTGFPHCVFHVFVSPHLDHRLLQEGNAEVGHTDVITA